MKFDIFYNIYFTRCLNCYRSAFVNTRLRWSRIFHAISPRWNNTQVLYHKFYRCSTRVFYICLFFIKVFSGRKCPMCKSFVYCVLHYTRTSNSLVRGFNACTHNSSVRHVRLTNKSSFSWTELKRDKSTDRT